jgi:LPS-assembly protein
MPPFPRLILSLLAASCFEAHADDVLMLRQSERIAPSPARGEQANGATHFEAANIKGFFDRQVEAEGSVIMRNPKEQVEADWLRYDKLADEAHARGNVVFSQRRDRVTGSAFRLKLSERLGEMHDVSYQLHTEDGKFARGETATLTFAGPDVYQMRDASYTTCAPGDDDWFLRMGDLKLDYVTSLGTARNTRIEFLGKPIVYVPWMDFALDDNRKSGFLSPSYGASTERGLELVTPWYWNIAPNRDATITPRVMSKRGMQLGGEFRYLEPDYHGEVAVELLPDDRQAERGRYRGLLRHQHRFDERWSGNFVFERVSDDRYFSDLSNLVSQTSQVNLPQHAELHYQGGWWQASGLLQRYQTLQDPDNPIIEPYHRLPQLRLNALKERLGGHDIRFDFTGEAVYFDHRAQGRVQGGRLYAQPSVAYPWQTAYAMVTPRLGLHLSRYALDGASRFKPDSLGYQPAGGFEDSTLALPVFSLDTSLFLERDWRFLGIDFLQTLEPRAYYVYIPYRDQSRVPVFDSSARELSLDQLFTENQYIGADRINDANQLTLALTSRLLDQDTGVERLQVTLGQRYYFTDQRVALPGQALRGKDSTDLLASISGQLTPRLSVRAGLQYDTAESDLSRANLGAGWRDGPGRVINADYRYTLGSLNQIDLSFQWPIAPRWHGLGRLNYSVRDSRLVEGLAGFEYNAGCWSLRAVMQRLATTETTANNAFFLQLELRGLTRLGPNPLEVLQRNISGYVQSSEIEPYLP